MLYVSCLALISIQILRFAVCIQFEMIFRAVLVTRATIFENKQ